ncbi:MAG: spondin domain-containing protein [Chloroflexi bacterium]|nr:spondin domain-containing protein [Chloroflexota bacterium]
MRKLIYLFALLLLMCSGSVFADSHDGDDMSMGMPYTEGGVAAVPVGGDGPAPAHPGGAYEFIIHANEGDSLTFASMLAQSNDGFLAPNEYGIALYDMGEPVSGDVTDQVYYWDLGSERNEPIGEGMYQAPRQAAPNSGPAGDGMVRLASDLNDNLSYPTADEIVSVTLTPGDMGTITVRIENVSDMSMYPSPITPVFWVVQSSDDMMMMDEMMMMDDDMSDDMADDDMSDDMADDDMSDDMDDDMGDDMMDDDMMMMKHGFLFTSGAPDYGYGLESLAEDGDPSALAAHHGIDMDDMMMDDM